MNCNNHSVKGTIFKLNVHMEPIDGFHMSEVDWEVDVYSSNSFGKKQTTLKKDAYKVDDDNYIIVIDSGVLGTGLYNITFTAWIPDGHCNDGKRIERVNVCTGVSIIG